MKLLSLHPSRVQGKNTSPLLFLWEISLIERKISNRKLLDGLYRKITHRWREILKSWNIDGAKYRIGKCLIWIVLIARILNAQNIAWQNIGSKISKGQNNQLPKYQKHCKLLASEHTERKYQEWLNMGAQITGVTNNESKISKRQISKSKYRSCKNSNSDHRGWKISK